MASKKTATPVQVEEEGAPAVETVDKFAEFHAEAVIKGKIKIQRMDEDHPDDPTQHVQALKNATEAGVFDYR
jgi:hypothetical protein